MIIDNYGIQLFKTCPKQYQHRIVKGLVGGAPRLAANFGIAIHEGLARLYKELPIDEAIKGFNEEWAQFEGLDQKDLYTKARGALILVTYYEDIMKKEALKVTPDKVEVGFSCEIPNSEHMLTGRIDLIPTLDNYVVIMDNKTRSKSLQSYCMYPNHQLMGYSYGAQTTLGLTQPPPYMVNLIKVAKKHNPADFNLRMTHHPNKKQMEDFFEDFIYWCAKMEECKNFNHYPKCGIEDSCAWCSYRELCEAPYIEERLVEEGVFRVKKWEPY